MPDSMAQTSESRRRAAFVSPWSIQAVSGRSLQGRSAGTGRSRCLQRHHGMVQPVQSEVVLGKAHTHPARGPDHVRRRAQHVVDDRSDAMTAGLLRQHRVLHRPQQHLGDMAQGVECLVGTVPPAGRVMEVHVLERALEGVLLSLLAPVAVHQFLQGQVVPRHQNHRVLGVSAG